MKQTLHSSFNQSHNLTEKHSNLILHCRSGKKGLNLVENLLDFTKHRLFFKVCRGSLVHCFRICAPRFNHLFPRLLDLLNLSACNPTCSLRCSHSDSLSPHQYTPSNTPDHPQPLLRVKGIFIACCWHVPHNENAKRH